MRFKNENTGDVIDVPRPDILGNGSVRFNGRVVERVTYSDIDASVTLSDGRKFYNNEFAEYLVKQLEIGAWNIVH